MLRLRVERLPLSWDAAHNDGSGGRGHLTRDDPPPLDGGPVCPKPAICPRKHRARGVARRSARHRNKAVSINRTSSAAACPPLTQPGSDHGPAMTYLCRPRTWPPGMRCVARPRVWRIALVCSGDGRGMRRRWAFRGGSLPCPHPRWEREARETVGRTGRCRWREMALDANGWGLEGCRFPRLSCASDVSALAARRGCGSIFLSEPGLL